MSSPPVYQLTAAAGGRSLTLVVEFPPSLWADLDGPVHYVDFGGPAGAQVIVCVHGLGGSHANWLAIAPGLARTHRVLALDLAGFGLTRAGARSTSVQANTALLHRFVTEVVPTLDGVAPGPVVLVGNSMGGLITALEAADHPGDVAGIALIDPALPLGPRALPDPVVLTRFARYLAPGLGSSLLRGRRTLSTPEQVAMEILEFCCADARRVPAEIVRAHVELGHRRGAYTEMDAEFIAATRSLIWLLRGRRRVLRTLRTIRCPVLLVHGQSDPLIPLRAARRVAAALPRWRFQVAPGLGHVPMLEDPAFTLDVLADWLPVTQGVSRPSSEQPTAGAG